MREWRTKQLRLMLLSTLLQASKGCMFTLSTLSPLVQRANSCVNDRLGSVIHMLMTDSVFPLFTAVYLVIRAFLLLKTTSGGPCTCFACGDIIRDEPHLFLLSLLFASFGYPTTSLKLNMDSRELCSLGNPYRSHYLYVLSIFVWWCYIVATL